MINKWKKILSLKEWSFITEEILPEQVTYGDYVPQKDRYNLPRQRINRSRYNT